MNYKKIYDSLMLSRKSRGLDKTVLEGYYERHHIIPRCMGGSDDENNLVLLTMREHLLAHLLLVKIYPNDIGVLNAINAMFICNVQRVTDIKYLRLRSIRFVAEIREAAMHRPISEEIRQHMRDGHKDITDEQREKYRKASTGRIQSLETRQKRSNTMKGRIFSDEHRKRISESKLGVIAYWPTKETNKKRSNSLKEFYKTHKRTKEDLKMLSERAKATRITEERGNKHKFSVINSDGKIFNSVQECANFYGVNRNTIRNWITKHPEKGLRYLDK